MVFILNLETSTTVCSVSVSGDGKILSLREQNDAKSHASQLNPFIEEALKEAGISASELSAIAVSKGPGSYTGLRIGVSTAKGMAYALQLPLIAIDTLYSMASGFRTKNLSQLSDSGDLLCPMIDARRMEVYSAVYNTGLEELREIKAEIIDDTSFKSLLESHHIHFFGDGAMKCRQHIHHKSAIFYDSFFPSSEFMGEIANRHYLEKKFVDLAYFEPFYLKDFVATIPGNKMF